MADQLKGSGVSLYDFACGKLRVLFASSLKLRNLPLRSQGRMKAAIRRGSACKGLRIIGRVQPEKSGLLSTTSSGTALGTACGGTVWQRSGREMREDNKTTTSPTTFAEDTPPGKTIGTTSRRTTFATIHCRPTIKREYEISCRTGGKQWLIQCLILGNWNPQSGKTE